MLKEEGQSLLHATNTWADKTMASTSSEGREVIRQQLARVQQQWDTFLSTISETRTSLESCLLKWSDYDDQADQINKWLKDIDRKLSDSELKVDLSEKKARLQKVKVSVIASLLLSIIFNTYSLFTCML